MSAISEAARRLREAEETKTPCPPVREALNNDLAAAYAVQEENHRHWTAVGRRLAGRKIALSNPAAQKAMGITEPAWGLLYADMMLGDGDTVAPGRVMQPRLEGEIAFVLGHDLAMEQPTLADALLAVAYCLPAIEVVGSRIARLDTTVVDLVADNASGGAFVLGSPARKPDGLDLRRQTMTMLKNGTQVAAGNGTAVWGSPLNALAWLAARCARDGLPLRAGETIMTGTFFAMQPALPGDAVEVIADGLGRCEVRFAD